MAAPRLRRALGSRLGLRRVPELRFVYDTGPDRAARVGELLGEIARETDKKPT
jgi:ribosome-binding factor A